MTDANKALARRWYDEVWNAGNTQSLAELLAPAAVIHGFPQPATALHGAAAFAHVLRQFRQAFPEIDVHVDDVIAECDTVAVRWTAHLRHTGDGLGLRATGREATVPGASFLVIRDGCIVAGWESMDLTYVRQELEREVQLPELMLA
jgi:steroid delta-isomerase-like uncharacterized protein